MLRSIILSCGWDVFRLAMAYKFFGGLANVSKMTSHCAGTVQVREESESRIRK